MHSDRSPYRKRSPSRDRANRRYSPSPDAPRLNRSRSRDSSRDRRRRSASPPVTRIRSAWTVTPELDWVPAESKTGHWPHGIDPTKPLSGLNHWRPPNRDRRYYTPCYVCCKGVPNGDYPWQMHINGVRHRTFLEALVSAKSTDAKTNGSDDNTSKWKAVPPKGGWPLGVDPTVPVFRHINWSPVYTQVHKSACYACRKMLLAGINAWQSHAETDEHKSFIEIASRYEKEKKQAAESKPPAVAAVASTSVSPMQEVKAEPTIIHPKPPPSVAAEIKVHNKPPLIGGIPSAEANPTQVGDWVATLGASYAQYRQQVIDHCLNGTVLYQIREMKSKAEAQGILKDLGINNALHQLVVLSRLGCAFTQ
jgi:hypothetical protein